MPLLSRYMYADHEIGEGVIEYECAYPLCRKTVKLVSYRCGGPADPWEYDTEVDGWYCCHAHRLQHRVMMLKDALEDAEADVANHQKLEEASV